MREQDEFESDVVDLGDIGLADLLMIPKSALRVCLERALAEGADSEAEFTRFTSQI